MKLEKRIPDTHIELLPLGADFLKVTWIIDGHKYIFYPSSAMGDQFGAFFRAIYGLYEECYETDEECRHSLKYDEHKAYKRGRNIKWATPDNDGFVSTEVSWDEEGRSATFIFSRHFDYEQNIYPRPNESDTIDIVIERTGCKKHGYRIEAKELCYAVAKAYTDALTKCGIYGYIRSSGGNCYGYGDKIDIDHFLFVKAYALNCLDLRITRVIWEKSPKSWQSCEGSDIKNEIKLLLFEM